MKLSVSVDAVVGSRSGRFNRTKYEVVKRKVPFQVEDVKASQAPVAFEITHPEGTDQYRFFDNLLWLPKSKNIYGTADMGIFDPPDEDVYFMGRDHLLTPHELAHHIETIGNTAEEDALRLLYYEHDLKGLAVKQLTRLVSNYLIVKDIEGAEEDYVWESVNLPSICVATNHEEKAVELTLLSQKQCKEKGFLSFSLNDYSKALEYAAAQANKKGYAFWDDTLEVSVMLHKVVDLKETELNTEAPKLPVKNRTPKTSQKGRTQVEQFFASVELYPDLAAEAKKCRLAMLNLMLIMLQSEAMRSSGQEMSIGGGYFPLSLLEAHRKHIKAWNAFHMVLEKRIKTPAAFDCDFLKEALEFFTNFNKTSNDCLEAFRLNLPDDMFNFKMKRFGELIRQVGSSYEDFVYSKYP